MQYSGDPYMGDKINRIWLKNYINIGAMGDFGQLYKEGFAQSEAFLDYYGRQKKTPDFRRVPSSSGGETIIN